MPVDAAVEVMGKAAKVDGGLFRASAPVQMGSNKIDVIATSNGAAPVTTTVLVTRGRTAAQLATAAAAKKKRQVRIAAARKAKAARARARRAAEARKDAASTQSSASDCVVVPNVIGKNHQSGQNTLQAAGFYMLDEEDATGEGRMVFFDRNWVDVGQEPAAGQCVPLDTTVTLSAKKIGE